MIESNQSKGVVDVETEDESAHKIGCLKIDDSIRLQYSYRNIFPHLFKNTFVIYSNFIAQPIQNSSRGLSHLVIVYASIF